MRGLRIKKDTLCTSREHAFFTSNMFVDIAFVLKKGGNKVELI